MIYYNESLERVREFESKVINFILSKLTLEEKKSYEDGERERKKMKRNKYVPDLILPKGCTALGLPVSSVVEIKYGVGFDSLQRVYSMFKHTFDKHGCVFVFIYRYTPAVSFSFPSESIIVLTDKELFALQKCQPKDVSPAIEYEPTRQTENKPLTQEEKLENCEEAFRKGNCTLFIGAGVSIDAGLDGWGKLLVKIKNKILQEGQSIKNRIIMSSDIKEIKKTVCYNSALVEARYLMTLSQADKEEKDYVKEIIDSKEIKDSKLINSIVNIVYYEEKNQHKVKRVITYNYDDLLEYFISKKGVIKPQSLFNGSDPIEEGCLPVFHVHGIIQKYYEAKECLGENIVLSEESYHNLYNQPYSWANIVQMYALSSSTCFFIGLSMSDPNLRRLLEASAKIDPLPTDFHYAFLKRADISESLKGINEEIVDKMFYELGVQVIWYNKYKELPELINSLIDK